MAELAPEIIREMERLYAELGSYKKVAKRLDLDKQSVKAHFEGGRNPMPNPKSTSGGKTNNQKKTMGTAISKHVAVSADNKRATAYKLYADSKSPLTVAVELGISADDAIRYQEEYWKLNGSYFLNHLQRVLPDIWSYLELYVKMKDLHLTPDQLMRKIDNKEITESEQKMLNLHEEIDECGAELEKLKSDIAEKQNLLKKHEFDVEDKNREYLRITDDVGKLEAKKNILVKFLQRFENSKTRSEIDELLDEETARLLANKHSKLGDEEMGR